MKTVFVTGISGYIGKSFVRRAKGSFNIIGVDLREDREINEAGVQFFKEDIMSENLKDIFNNFKPDTVIHLAFVLNPPKDRERARTINIDGTKNILKLSKEFGVKHLIVLTSATAYGALKDNPVPIKEDFPIRGDQNKGFWYSEDKAEQDRIVQEFAKKNPEMKVAIVRPCIVFGENVDNYISQGFFNPPIIATFERDIPYQFIHEDDVADALIKMVEKESVGPFNLAGGGYVYTSDMVRIMNKKTIKAPRSKTMRRLLVFIMKRMNYVDRNVPFEILSFFSYPWVLDTQRAEKELGFIPKYTSEETFIKAYETWKMRREKTP